MATVRLEPFRKALFDLRRRLREGELGPGSKITAKEVADGLRLSPTPVREALSRLAGEGLLEEHRGDGFFVPELSAADIAVLYGISDHLLSISQGAPPAEARPLDPLAGDPIPAVERLFLGWVADANSRTAKEIFRTVTIRLAPVRRAERTLIEDLAPEAEALFRLAEGANQRQRGVAVRAFHKRRIALAEPLARTLERPKPEGM